jgi:hypothetical protein
MFNWCDSQTSGFKDGRAKVRLEEGEGREGSYRWLVASKTGHLQPLTTQWRHRHSALASRVGRDEDERACKLQPRLQEPIDNLTRAEYMKETSVAIGRMERDANKGVSQQRPPFAAIFSRCTSEVA